MKATLLALSIPVLFASGAGQAMPYASPGDVRQSIDQVQMQCNPSRCVDVRTGVYTQSTCNRRGCFPLGGAVGRLGPDGDDSRAYRRRRYYDDDGYDRPRRRYYDDRY